MTKFHNRLKCLLVVPLAFGLLICTNVSAQPGDEAVIYVHTDALGNPVAKTDSTGKVIWRQSYAPYGQTYQQADPDGPGFTGHHHDVATDLVYMQARYYDPKIGRFLSVDPATFSVESPGHFNLYWYANDNPIVNIDPDGRETGRTLQAEWRMMGAKPQLTPDSAGKLIAGATLGLVAVPIVALIAPEVMAGGVRIVARQVTRNIVMDGAKIISKSLKDQAADLVVKNGGKNRVTIELPSQKIEIDLAGKSHNGIETPHVKVSQRNLKAPNQPAYNTKSAQVRHATQDDIDMAKRHLDHGQ